MSMKQQPLLQENYIMKIIKDLGKTTANENTTNLGRYAIFECRECNTHFKARASGKAARKQTKCKKCTLNEKQTCKHPLYSIWNSIRQRCYNEKRKDYSKYGGVGVTMCEEWLDNPQKFIEFCLSNGWEEGKVIDKDIKCRKLKISPAIYGPNTLSFITIQQNAEEANAKVVLQFNLFGDFMAEFPSAVKAALHIGKSASAKSSISNCCRGVSKTSFGFKWRYK